MYYFKLLLKNKHFNQNYMVY